MSVGCLPWSMAETAAYLPAPTPSPRACHLGSSTVRLTALNLPLDGMTARCARPRGLADAMPPVKKRWPTHRPTLKGLRHGMPPPQPGDQTLDGPLSSLGWNLGVAVEFSLAEARPPRASPARTWRSTDRQSHRDARPESVEGAPLRAHVNGEEDLPMSPIQAEWEGCDGGSSPTMSS